MENTFLSNDTKITFLDYLKESLANCDEFNFSVSFIKDRGLSLIFKDIEEALKRGVKGRLITSTYQNFTDVNALKRFYVLSNNYSNFEVRLDFNSFGNAGFHTKGYLFKDKDDYKILVGSTNITTYALQKNKEWNVSILSKDMSESYVSALKEFDEYWDSTLALDLDVINKYSDLLNYAVVRWDMDDIVLDKKLKPNIMQRKALKEIARQRDAGINRALVIAATGSGKTLLAAFDARVFDPKRLLFIVHRETILADAKLAFEKVFERTRTCGILSGNEKDYSAEFIFATNQTMVNNLDMYSKDYFDYIIVDEVHHAVASTYKKIIDYFEPEFLLGLTATPERMDDQAAIYELFDYNVPYELRLRDALENDLVVPFKYFGIKDKYIDYDKDDATKIIIDSTKDEHIDFMIKQINDHKVADQKLKCICFCRSVTHCHKMEEIFNNRGYNTIALDGDSNTLERQTAFRRIQDNDDNLSIIFTRDILNEGVDIPDINMVIFLRPTESSTVFIQQLGRGLRKFKDKKYLVVLDFIANSYKRSVQIAFALGSLSKSTILEKKLLVSMVKDDFKSLDIKDLEINFDQISKDEVISYIESTNFNAKEFVKKDYDNFKKALGLVNEYPKQIEYLSSDAAPDLIRLLKCKYAGTKSVSYYNFLTKIDPDSNIPNFTEDEAELITAISDYLPLVRSEEYLIIDSLLKDQDIDFESLKSNYFGFELNEAQYQNSLFFLQKDGILNETFDFPIELSQELKDFIQDTVDYGLRRYLTEFGLEAKQFKLYNNYYTSDIMKKLLKDSKTFMKGTLVDKKTGIVYILAGLKKDLVKEEHLKYNDKFISKNVFQWESTTNVTMDNNSGKELINSTKCLLFIRKVKEEDGVNLPYTFIGEGKLINPRPSDNPKKSLLFDCELVNELPEFLHYDFMLEEN